MERPELLVFSRSCLTKAALPSWLSKLLVTGTARAGVQHMNHRLAVMRAIFTAVCALLVVAPPISSGTLKPVRSISRATCAISSSEGVIRPERPMISAFSPGRFQNLFARHHDAEVNHFVVIAGQHHADDVLADVVHVALDCGEHDASGHLVVG